VQAGDDKSVLVCFDEGLRRGRLGGVVGSWPPLDDSFAATAAGVRLWHDGPGAATLMPRRRGRLSRQQQPAGTSRRTPIPQADAGPQSMAPDQFPQTIWWGGHPSVRAGLSTDYDPAGEHCRGRVGQNIKRIIKIARGIRRGTGNPTFTRSSARVTSSTGRLIQGGSVQVRNPGLLRTGLFRILANALAVEIHVAEMVLRPDPQIFAG
jgi:hypothetical protein